LKKIFSFSQLSSTDQSQWIENLFYRNYFLRNKLYEDYHGRTPIHFAAANRHLNLIQYDYQGIKHKNRWRISPIDEIRKNDSYHIVQQLTQLEFQILSFFK
jgi:ankyrin repeat protein